MALLVVSDPTDGIVTLTLNRPEKKNALSIALRDEMSNALDGLAAHEEVRVVIVTGRIGVLRGIRPRRVRRPRRSPPGAAVCVE